MAASNLGGGDTRVLVGRTPSMLRVWEQIEQVGAKPWPVLILGETGTGKELVARTIHNQGTGPFVVVDCSALVGPLMESELFGHVKGAFTGATATKLGLIELANGGTAFFDEIGELPLDLQAKLLRVIQEKEFRPVGAIRTRTSNFRLVAATHRNLAAEVKKGTFRQDLYYRMKVITLRLPPLRERREDIPELITYFLRRHRSSHVFEHQIMDAMLSYDWPGNVRELDNCVQHAVAHCRGEMVGLRELPTTVANHIIAGRSDVLSMAAAVESQAPERYAQERHGQQRVSPLDADDGLPKAIHTLADVERMHILRVLDYTKGDRAAAAMYLDIGRTTLYRKLKEYGVPIET